MLPAVAIQDACILIDLVKVELMDRCMVLPWQFMTTDLVASEIDADQWNDIEPLIVSRQLQVISTSIEDLILIETAAEESGKLSPQDCSVIFHAEKMGAMVLSSDKHVIAGAKVKGLECHGLLWILDQLVDRAVIETSLACKCLKLLMTVNTRLPEAACQQRINLWCSTATTKK